MATDSNVTFDGEFMHQIVPAMPISSRNSFHAVRGSNNKQILFSIGDAGQLFLIRPDDSVGRCLLTDIGALLGIPKTSTISALAVTQSNDMRIFVTFSVIGQPEIGSSEIHVVRPTHPNEWESLDGTDISAWLLHGEVDPKVGAYKLFLGPLIGTEATYPSLIVVYTDLDKKVTDAARLDVRLPESRWTFDHSFTLPEDPSFLISACCGCIAPNRYGVFCLYEIQGKVSLIFSTLDTNIGTYKLQVRPDAKSLATFINRDGLTDLIVGGSNLYYYPAAVCRENFLEDEPEHFSVISGGPLMSDLLQLFIAQEGPGTDISVFTCNKENNVLYQQFRINQGPKDESATLNAITPPVPLLASAEGGGHFTAIFDAASGSQFLYILDYTGQLTFMEQSGVTRIWKANKILVQSSDSNHDIITFTTHAHLTGPNGTSLARKSFLLSSSSPISMHVNGRFTYVTPDGVTVTTDSSSNLTIIHQVDDISTVSFTIQDAPTETKQILGRPFTYDPSEKPLSKLGSLTEEKLRNATLSDGSKLVPSSISDSDIANTVKMISDLHSSAQKLATGTEPGGQNNSSAHPEGVTSGGHPDSVLWDIWHWLSKSASNIKRWFVDAWEFVVETGEGIYRFFLKAVSHVMKAISWAFDKISVGLNKLLEYLGFVFDWSDILDMHNILIGVTNCALDVVADGAKSAAAYIDSCFGKVEEWVSDLDPTSDKYNYPTNLGGQQTKMPLHNGLNTPAGNWSNYQIEHGGVGRAMQAVKPQATSPAGVADVFSQLWDDVLSPAFNSCAKLVSDLVKNLETLFSNGLPSKLGDILKHLGVDLLRDIIVIIRKVVVGLIEFCGHLVEDIKAGMNSKINIPLLSALYRGISGNDLTMLDAVVLLISVPTTVSYKLITGKRPRDIEGLANLLNGEVPIHPQNHTTGETPQLAPQILAFNVFPEALPGSIKAANSKQDAPVIEAGVSDILSKINTVVLAIYKLYRFVQPIINLMSLPWTALKWFAPDIDDRFEAEYFQVDHNINVNGKQLFKPDTTIDLTLQIFSTLFSFPCDLVPFPLPFKVTKEPAPEARAVIWALEGLIIPVKFFIRRKRSLALFALLSSGLQFFPTCFMIYQNVSADKNKFPGLDGVTVGLSTAQSVLSMVAKIAGCFVVHQDGKEPYTFIVAYGASELTCATQQIIAIRDDGDDAYASYTSLRNLVTMF
ncbi:hypothetical protein RSOLAG1IB_05970 [Rhizoctonia solani AG-1 IB]|uniref:Uncharacterized protein n=1 Tax=Thanatephorus cucumeris (strain AG1-IB / isolate 7/3/14) TaxID=1108050 RepID=M5BPP0_THACB|nr:hypothetical protein BN14_03736 [Rhizoctonia solani AG-1 IB]CEL52902.1 hypothetical protein RSOLAG1IB_05970 [Rhizoctonia solani AG-1 IB]